QPFVRDEIPAAEAREIFARHPYKLQIIDDASTDPMSGTGDRGEARTYENPPGKPKDHPPFPVEPPGRHLGHFKLLPVAGAYWRADEHNPQLQRIYGTAWHSKEALEAHLT